jgi:hypothetical protein
LRSSRGFKATKTRPVFAEPPMNPATFSIAGSPITVDTNVVSFPLVF